MEKLANATIRANRLDRQCTILPGLISRHQGGRDFALRQGMGSSSDLEVAGVQEIRRVRTISPGAILDTFPGPYDLIKVDIEGGEYDFLEHYVAVYATATFILLEWHSPDREGSGENHARDLLTARGFRFLKTVRSKRELQLEDNWYSSGVQLYQRAGSSA